MGSRSSSSARWPAAMLPRLPAATSRRRWSGTPSSEATGSKPKKRAKNDVSDRDVVVLGSGNLGLIYLMEEKRRLTCEEIDERHPRLVGALREHPHVGWLLVRSSEHGALVLGAGRGPPPRLRRDRRRGSARLLLADTAAEHLIRTDGFAHVADIMVGSFYDPERDEGCAFEELICFHGGLGGASDAAVHPARRSAARARAADSGRGRGTWAALELAPQAAERRPAAPRGSARGYDDQDEISP